MNNLFNRVYENAWSYAVPGRELFVGLRYAPNSPCPPAAAPCSSLPCCSRRAS
jgi:hypothetical protein